MKTSLGQTNAALVIVVMGPVVPVALLANSKTLDPPQLANQMLPAESNETPYGDAIEPLVSYVAGATSPLAVAENVSSVYVARFVSAIVLAGVNGALGTAFVDVQATNTEHASAAAVARNRLVITLSSPVVSKGRCRSFGSRGIPAGVLARRLVRFPYVMRGSIRGFIAKSTTPQA